VRQNIKTQLDAVARFTPEVNAAYASMAGNVYAVQAARMGMPPEALWEQMPMNIVGENVAGGLDGVQYGQSLAAQPPQGWKHSTDGQDAAAMWDGTENNLRALIFLTPKLDVRAVVLGIS